MNCIFALVSNNYNKLGLEDQIAFCKISAAGIRQRPDSRSPLLSQVLFGEVVKIIRRKSKRWCRIECSWDNVIGWVDLKQFHVPKNDVSDFVDCDSFALELIHGAISSNQVLPITIGANLWYCDGINFKVPFGKFQYSGQILNLEQSGKSAKLLVNVVKRFVHAPYLYGGRSIGGIDSAALAQLAFKLIGIGLPRYAHEQAELGNDVGFLEQSRVGDLAFFQDKGGDIIHVGIVLEDQKIIHVDGMVRIDGLDQQGIFDLNTKKYSFRLRTIRRPFELNHN